MVELLAQAAQWTAARGFPNWPRRFAPDRIAVSAAKRELFVAEFDGVVVATLTLQWHDPRFWGDVGAERAGYVHRLAVRRSCAGRGLGYQLLNWADEQVQAKGGTWLRLDVATDNGRLRRHYDAARFVHCRDVEGEDVSPDGTAKLWRTSLYERHCDPTRDVR